MKLVLWPIALSAFAIPNAVKAETQDAFLVSAAIQPGCAVASVADGQWGRIDFGTVPGTGQGLVEVDLIGATGTGISIECTPGTTVSVSADHGLNPSAGVRHLAHSGGGGGSIPYRFVLAAGGGTWETQSLPLEFNGTQRVQAIALRGRATLSGAHVSGMYSDTVRITIAW